MRRELREKYLDLSQRYLQIDRNNKDNVLAFLYSIDTDKYDENNALDIFELYLFATTYGKYTKKKIKSEIALQSEIKKMPPIMKLADRANSIVEEYESIREFASVTIEKKDDLFIDFYREVIEMCYEMVEIGYTCYIKSYPNDNLRGRPHHVVYLSKKRHIEKLILKILRIFLDGQLDALPVVVEFIKPASDGEEQKRKTFCFRKTSRGFIDEEIINNINMDKYKQGDN